MFCSARDSISIQQKTHVIYKVPFPGWNEDDLRKTDRNLVTRLDKNASPWGSTYVSAPIEMWKLCTYYSFTWITRHNASTAEINNKQHFVNAGISNFCVLDTCCNWSQLLFLEAVYFKNVAPKFNDGLKATCKLCFILIGQQLT